MHWILSSELTQSKEFGNIVMMWVIVVQSKCCNQSEDVTSCDNNLVKILKNNDYYSYGARCMSIVPSSLV